MILFIILLVLNVFISVLITKIFYAVHYTYYLEVIDQTTKIVSLEKFKLLKRKKYIQAGMTPKERKIYIIIEFLVPLLVMILGWNTPIKAFFMALLVVLVAESNLMRRVNQRKLIFKANGYKIYRFLFNQISSGIRINDAVKNIYEVVENEALKDNLIKFSALYTQTLDIDLALNFLKTKYTGVDINNLSMAIQQGINTGDNLEIIKRQEDLMFNKYISYIRLKTQLKKKYYLVIVLLFTLIIVFMISIPIIKNLLLSTETIFI